MDEIKLTLLAPARDLTVAKAAIQAGVDAVYIGASRFGARVQAGNSLEDIATLVNYAHPYGVQVLVTLNTLLTDTERKEAVAMAWELYKIGVDALIIQDLQLLNEDLPPIRLHASTQCDNRTPEDVLRLQSLGFKRVVLARELTIDEIRNISNTLNSKLSTLNSASNAIELEAFIHGACCVSYSGRCYMSEVLMNRSANRGCCAQMCRMAYDLLDKDFNEVLDDEGKPIHQRYLLSLQDMDRSQYLQELIEAGVTTFKIEGRLKDADYVTNIVAYYRQLLDQLPLPHRGESEGACFTYTFTPNPEKTFHRGACDYFLHGRTPNMANWSTPKSTGEYVGEIVNNRIQVAPGIELHNGDGLCVGDQGFYFNGNNNLKLYTTAKGALTLNFKLSTLNSKVYRNHDAAFLKSLQAERRVLVDILFEETESGFRLTIGDLSNEFDYPHQPANNPERAMNTIKEQLTKLGDTIYQARKVEIHSQPYFIPISTLNQWRRQTINRS